MPAEEAVLAEWVAAHGTLYAAAAAHPDRRALEGRGAAAVYVVPRPGRPDDGWWAVRHYRRGGAVARLLGDRYLRLGRPRPLRELSVTRALETLGVPAPRAVGAAVYSHGPFYTGDLITEYIPAATELSAVLFPAAAAEAPRIARPAPGASMEAAGRLLRVLHDRGVVHPDLNLRNILVRGGDGGVEALVLDLDRARIARRVGPRARRRMTGRFWRSVRKWESATGAGLDPRLRTAFEAGYGGEPPSS